MNLQDILKNTNYDDVLFTNAEKVHVGNALFTKQSKSTTVPYIQCFIRKKEIKITPNVHYPAGKCKS